MPRNDHLEVNNGKEMINENYKQNLSISFHSSIKEMGIIYQRIEESVTNS